MGLPDGFSTYLSLTPRTLWLDGRPLAINRVSETGSVRVEY